MRPKVLFGVLSLLAPTALSIRPPQSNTPELIQPARYVPRNNNPQVPIHRLTGVAPLGREQALQVTGGSLDDEVLLEEATVGGGDNIPSKQEQCNKSSPPSLTDQLKSKLGDLPKDKLIVGSITLLVLGHVLYRYREALIPSMQQKQQEQNGASSLFSTSVGCPKQYANKRTMTPFQEKINAITILPSALLSLYYIFSGGWLLEESVQKAEQQALLANTNDADPTDCITFRLFPNLHGFPPPTILAICLGILLHCPCSFLYHWFYADNPDPVARLKHWSRRMDHSAIHACSACWSYATSGGNLPFFAVNVLYNADSILRHMEEEIQPKRNQLRILGSMLLYTSPLLFLSDEDGNKTQLLLFGKIWALFVVALWLFAAYPLRGWSHAAFHIVMIAIPPLLWDMVAKNEADGEWSMAAAKRAVLKQKAASL